MCGHCQSAWGLSGSGRLPRRSGRGCLKLNGSRERLCATPAQQPWCEGEFQNRVWGCQAGSSRTSSLEDRLWKAQGVHAAVDACFWAGTGAVVPARGQGAYLEGEVWAWNNVWLSSVGGLHAGPRNTSVTFEREKAMADSSRSCWLSTGAAQQQVLRQAGTLLLSAVSCSCRTRQHALRQAGADLTDDGPLIWTGGAHIWCQAPSPVMGVNVSVGHKR